MADVTFTPLHLTSSFYRLSSSPVQMSLCVFPCFCVLHMQRPRTWLAFGSHFVRWLENGVPSRLLCVLRCSRCPCSAVSAVLFARFLHIIQHKCAEGPLLGGTKSPLHTESVAAAAPRFAASVCVVIFFFCLWRQEHTLVSHTRMHTNLTLFLAHPDVPDTTPPTRTLLAPAVRSAGLGVLMSSPLFVNAAN